MGCRHYLDSDRKAFGEVSTVLGIEQFCRTKRVNSLRVFQLLYC
jgi:hypothetical protein